MRDKINPEFFSFFKEHVQSKLVTFITGLVGSYQLSNEILVSLIENGKTRMNYYGSDHFDLIDELLVQVCFRNDRNRDDDEGFIITFEIYYDGDGIYIESDIFRGITGDSTNMGSIVRSPKIQVSNDDLSNFSGKLKEYCEISGLLVKEYVLDYHC